MESNGRGFAIESAGGDVENNLLPCICFQSLCGKQFVFTQKDEATGKRDSFVAIDKGVIATQVVKVRSRNLDRIGKQWLAQQRCLWSRNRRFQQCLIANAGTTTVCGKDLRVNRFD